MADERDGERGNMAAWRQCVYGNRADDALNTPAYWLFASFATFRLLFGQNDGVLRGYAVAGVLGGMVFYDRTGSRLLFAVLKKCSGWIKMKRRGKKSQKTGKKRTTRGQAENMERK